MCKTGHSAERNWQVIERLSDGCINLVVITSIEFKNMSLWIFTITNTFNGPCVNIAEKLSVLNISDMLYSGDTTVCSYDTDVLKDEPMDVDVKPNYRTAIVEQGYLLKPCILVLSLVFPYKLIKE